MKGNVPSQKDMKLETKIRASWSMKTTIHSTATVVVQENEKKKNSAGSDVVAFICMKKSLASLSSCILVKESRSTIAELKPTIEQIISKGFCLKTSLLLKP